MKVFILMDATETSSPESIVGVFESLGRAKLALANYVLNTEVDRIEPCYVEIADFEVDK